MNYYLIFDDLTDEQGDLYRVTFDGCVQFEVNGEWVDSIWDNLQDLEDNLIGDNARIEEVPWPGV